MLALLTLVRSKHSGFTSSAIVREKGAAIPLIIVFITVILIFAGLALDTTVISVSKTEHRQLAENVALTGLSTYLNSNPADPIDTRLALVRAKTQEIIQGSIKFSRPFMVSPSPTDDVETRRGAIVDGTDGTLIPGNWYNDAPANCGAFPVGTVCPCDGATNPWKGPCFEEIDIGILPTPQINAFTATLKLSGNSAVRTLFSKIFYSSGQSELTTTATATIFPRHGVFAIDLSRSSHEETHQPYESTVGSSPGMRLSAEYAFGVNGTVADVQACAAAGWPFTPSPPSPPVGGICDIRGGVVPQLYRALWYGAGGFTNIIPATPRPLVGAPLRKHYKGDYTPFALTWSDPGIRNAPPFQQTYLVDTYINPNATPTSYEGPEPLNSMIAGVNRGLARIAANTVPGDQIGILGFDFSAQVTERIIPLSAPGSVTFNRALNLTDPTINPVPQCLETPARNVRECRIINHLLISRTESGMNLPEALRQARQMLLDAGNPLGAEEFVVVMSDGITNCSRSVGSQRTCGADEPSVTASFTEVENIIANTYIPNSLKLHFIHVGEAAGPHTLLSPSPYRKNADGTSAGCMSDEEAQKFSEPTNPLPSALSNYKTTGTGNDFANGTLNAFASYSATTGTYINRTFRFFEPSRLRSKVAATSGSWTPIRPPCAPGQNITNYVENLCNGQTFSQTAGVPNTINNAPNIIADPPTITDSEGRLMCEPDDTDTYAPNPAPAAGQPIQPRSSRRTQIMRAVDKILSRSPYIIVQ